MTVKTPDARPKTGDPASLKLRRTVCYVGQELRRAGEILTDFNKLVFPASEADFFGVLNLPFAVEVGVFGYFV